MRLQRNFKRIQPWLDEDFRANLPHAKEIKVVRINNQPVTEDATEIAFALDDGQTFEANRILSQPRHSGGMKWIGSIV